MQFWGFHQNDKIQPRFRPVWRGLLNVKTSPKAICNKFVIEGGVKFPRNPDNVDYWWPLKTLSERVKRSQRGGHQRCLTILSPLSSHYSSFYGPVVLNIFKKVPYMLKRCVILRWNRSFCKNSDFQIWN